MAESSSPEKVIEHYDFVFPIRARLTEHLKQSGFLKGKRIAWHCHLTAMTAALARAIIESGADLILSECSPATSDLASVEFMKKLGARVYQGEEGRKNLLDQKPQIISDTGLVLTQQYLEEGSPYVYGASEITTSGIQKLRAIESPAIPVINVNDGQLKTQIENYHGVAEGVMESLTRVSGRVWAGRPVAVAGYGSVGAGIADYLRRAGALVRVVESEPVRKLIAHYDGFALAELHEAISKCELLVTATGKRGLVSRAELEAARDGIILMNVGHWPDEIDIAALKTMASRITSTQQNFEHFLLPGVKADKQVHLIGGGGPANVVMLTGSCEATLIHISTEILCMNYLLENYEKQNHLKEGEIAIPEEVERTASLLALKSLGLA